MRVIATSQAGEGPTVTDAENLVERRADLGFGPAMGSQGTDELDDLAAPNCPVDLVPMVDEGAAVDAHEARWVRPVCGQESIAE